MPEEKFFLQLFDNSSIKLNNTLGYGFILTQQRKEKKQKKRKNLLL
jgi:hypothetical protein